MLAVFGGQGGRGQVGRSPWLPGGWEQARSKVVATGGAAADVAVGQDMEFPRASASSL